MTSTRTHAPRIRRLAAVATACTILIAACGSDDGTADTTDSTEAATTADSTASETTTSPETTSPETSDAPETTTLPETTDAPETTEATAATSASDPASTDASAAAGTIGEVATAAGATFIPSYTAYAPGYDAAINGDGPVTTIMPSDDGFIAFSAQYPDLTNQMREDFDALDSLLQYHVIDGALLVEALETGTDLMTLQGEPITVEVTDGVVVLNGGQATITTADLEAGNGVVHIIDGILLPPSLAATAS